MTSSDPTAPLADVEEAQVWAEQWAKLFALAGEVLITGDAVMDAMRGDLGLPRGATREQVAPIIAERIDAYQAARRAMIVYAREWEERLDG